LLAENQSAGSVRQAGGAGGSTHGTESNPGHLPDISPGRKAAFRKLGYNKVSAGMNVAPERKEMDLTETRGLFPFWK
jgi:hypothetical protein